MVNPFGIRVLSYQHIASAKVTLCNAFTSFQSFSECTPRSARSITIFVFGNPQSGHELRTWSITAGLAHIFLCASKGPVLIFSYQELQDIMLPSKLSEYRLGCTISPGWIPKAKFNTMNALSRSHLPELLQPREQKQSCVWTAEPSEPA